MEIREIGQWANLFVLIVTAVWAVTKIKITTEKLSMSIDHLRETVVRLDKNYETTTKDLSTVRERVTRLEGAHQAIKTG